MANMWCINCKGYRNHAYVYCHGECGNNCYNQCSSCGRETLVSTAMTTNRPLNANEMIAQAQMSGKTGELTVYGGTGNVHTEERNDRELRYNTYTGDYQYYIVQQNK